MRSKLDLVGVMRMFQQLTILSDIGPARTNALRPKPRTSPDCGANYLAGPPCLLSAESSVQFLRGPAANQRDKPEYEPEN